MRKVNIIILCFFLFVGTLIYGVKVLVQSEKFAKIISHQVTENVFKKINTSIKFSKIEVQLLPPGAIFHDVQIQGQNLEQQIQFQGEFKTLEFDFGVVDILANRLVIKNVEGTKGKFEAEGKGVSKFWESINSLKEKDEKKSDLKLKELFQGYVDQVYSRMPVQIERITLSESLIKIQTSHLNIDKLFLFMGKSSVESRFHLSQIKLNDWQYYSSINEIPFISMDVFFNATHLKIRSADMKWGQESLGIVGNFKENPEGLILDSKILVKGKVQKLWPFVPVKIREKDLASGNFEGEFVLKGTFDKPEVVAKIKGDSFKTPWVNLDSFSSEVKLQNDHLFVQHFKAEHDKGYAELKRVVELWDLKKNDFIDHDAIIVVQQLHTNSALRVLSPDLDILKGRASGSLIIKWDRIKSEVVFELQPNFTIENFSLIDQKSKQVILQNKKLTFNKSSFLLKKNLDVLMEIDATFPFSHIVAKGILADKDLEFSADQAQIDFKEFGPISGVPLKGKALIDMHISGPYDNVRFDFEVNSQDFSVADFQLGSAKGEVNFFLKDTSLLIPQLKGKIGETDYEGKGIFAFEKDEPIDLSVNIKKARYSDLRLILAPLFKNLTFFPEKDFAFSFHGPFKIKGAFDLPKLKINGTMFGREIQYSREDFDSFEAQLNFGSNTFTASQIRLQKGPATLTGKISYDVGSDFLEFDASLKKMKLQDSVYYRALNLGYAAEIQGEFYGSGTMDDFSSKAYVSLTDGHVNNIAVPDSVLNLYGNGSDLFLKGHFLGDLLNFDSYLNLSEKVAGKTSYINARVKAPDAKILWGLVSQNNTSDFSLRGNLDAELKSSFTFKEWKNFDLLLELNDFWLARKDFILKTDRGHNRIIVKNGQVGSWDIQLSGNGNSISSIGEGSFKNKLNVQNNFEVDASIAEVFSERIQKFGGKLKGRSVLVGDQEHFSHYFELFGDKLTLKIVDVPSVFEEIQLGLVLNDDTLLIRDLHGRYGKGDFVVEGNIKLKTPSPVFDLGVTFRNSYVPLFKKSYVVGSGKVKMLGNSFPYRLEGNLSVQQSEILDEFSDMTGKGSDSSVQNRFIPKSKNATVIDFITLGLDWDIIRPIVIKNSMTEIKIDGRGRLTGGNSSPTIQGELNLIPNESKFYFKGHEFVISEGKIQFSDPLLRNQADIRILGQADIAQYKVKVVITGKNDNIALALSSDPFLSQEDVLSLLAIGVTSDISRGMGETERRSMTSLGLGSLLMDQMRINQGLTSQLGLKLSVIPEFSEDESTIMAGRAESSSQAASRVKSTTKIKVQKKITNNMDVSVASTMGGTMEQKQEMNVNYNFSKNVSLQGIYEVKASDNTENAPSEISAGADLKFKWSFK